MPRKKSGKHSAQVFNTAIEQIRDFLVEIDESGCSDRAISWAYEAGIIKLAVAFEHLMLDCLVTAINNDTATITERTGVEFPKHLTDEVCEYLVTGGRFFDFKGRDGLIRTIKEFVPNNHWLLTEVKKRRYKAPLDLLIALRNYAAHESDVSKRSFLEQIDQTRIGSAGSWAKRQGRFTDLLDHLLDLADDIEAAAPY